MNCPPKRWEGLSSIGLMAPVTILLYANSACAIPSHLASSDTDETITAKQFVRKFSTTPPPVVNNLQAAIIPIHRVEVVGSTILDAADFKPITQSLEHQPINLTTLKQAADAVTQLYLKRGFATSRAIVPPQTLNSDVVKLQIIEGWLGEIQVKGTRQLQPSYIQSRLRLAAGSPLNLGRLEAQIRLLNTDPMLEHLEASLRAGTKPGESILIVNVKEAKRYSSSFSTDNYSSANGLPEKTRVSASYRNPIGLGDELSISTVLGSPESNQDESRSPQNYELSYRIPVNAIDGAVQIRAAVDDRLLGDSAFAVLGLRSRNEAYSLTYRQPILRSLRQEFALSLGFSAQKSQTFLFKDVPYPFGSSADANGITQTRILQFGQDYSRRDALGIWNASSQLNFGLGILDATQHSGSIPDGQFFSWQLQGQRIQQLGNGNLLIAQGNLQLSPDSLLSSQQFSLGGGQSVRSFRQNVRTGDNGWRLSLEGRIPLIKSAKQRPILQLAPFGDAGAVWNSAHNPSGSIAKGFLAGAGVGLLWQPRESLSLRLDYGVPLVNLVDRSNGLRDGGLYFSITTKQ
jgi:hemolysin activation/secretion protein